jgi:hypothetical protein
LPTSAAGRVYVDAVAPEIAFPSASTGTCRRTGPPTSRPAPP